MILFRRRYPAGGSTSRWSSPGSARASARTSALLTDQYPSTVEEQSVHLEVDYPDVERDLNRWLPLVKWLLAIPHFLVLIVLSVGAFFAVVIAWFAILFTGRYPRGLVRLRGRRQPLVVARPGVRDPSRHRPLPALLPHLSPPEPGNATIGVAWYGPRRSQRSPGLTPEVHHQRRLDCDFFGPRPHFESTGTQQHGGSIAVDRGLRCGATGGLRTALSARGSNRG